VRDLFDRAEFQSTRSRRRRGLVVATEGGADSVQVLSGGDGRTAGSHGAKMTWMSRGR